MPNIRVNLPRVHMAGSNNHYNAHIDVGQHGFAVFLTPDADYPLLDIDGTPEQLSELVGNLQSALLSRSLPSRGPKLPRAAELPPLTSG